MTPLSPYDKNDFALFDNKLLQISFRPIGTSESKAIKILPT